MGWVANGPQCVVSSVCVCMCAWIWKYGCVHINGCQVRLRCHGDSSAREPPCQAVPWPRWWGIPRWLSTAYFPASRPALSVTNPPQCGAETALHTEPSRAWWPANGSNRSLTGCYYIAHECILKNHNVKPQAQTNAKQIHRNLLTRAYSLACDYIVFSCLLVLKDHCSETFNHFSSVYHHARLKVI